MDFEERIRTWLMDEEILLEKKFDENADFHYIVEFPKENIMDVVKPRVKDLIVVACATQVSPEHLSLMKASSPKNRRDFLFDLQFGLNSYLVDFDLNVNKDILQHFVVTSNVYEDGISKNEFMRTLNRVFKSKLFCIFLINKQFGHGPNKPSNENDMFV